MDGGEMRGAKRSDGEKTFEHEGIEYPVEREDEE